MKSFLRANVAAFLATLVDFGTLSFWVEVLSGYYPIGVALGAFFGAVTNFFVNRHWSFKATSQSISLQASRYALVSFGSLLLNTLFVYLITEHFKLFYLNSKLVVSILVSLLYNYPLHRYFVYRKEA